MQYKTFPGVVFERGRAMGLHGLGAWWRPVQFDCSGPTAVNQRGPRAV